MNALHGIKFSNTFQFERHPCATLPSSYLFSYTSHCPCHIQISHDSWLNAHF